MGTTIDDEKMQKVRELASKINYADLIQKGNLTVANIWTILATFIYKDKQPPEIQRNEMRRTFYMGFTECFRIMTDAADAMSEDQASDFLTKISKEVNEFHEQEIKRLVP